MKKFPLSIIL